MVDELNMKRVPERRFPEFKNDGEWEESLFAESFDFLPNNTLSRADLNYNAGIVRNVHYGDVLIKFGNCLDVKECNLPFITNEKVTEKISQSKLKNGDVVIADTAEDEMVGKCSEIINLTDEIVVSGLHTIPIRPISQFAPLFLGFYLNSESYRRQLIPLMQGIKVVALSKGAFSKTKILYPKNLAEQKKIADSLSFLDGSISLVKKKLELLKLQKKGLMQKLFPAQGEKIPRYRFKEFENDGGWKEIKLGEIMNISSVKRVHESEWTKAGVRFLRARDLVAEFKKEKFDDFLYISKEMYEECSKVSGKVNIGDLLVTGVGTIGIPKLIIDSNPIYFKDGNIIWFHNNNRIDGKFFYYSFLGDLVQNFIKMSAGVGTVGTYTIESAKKTPIFLPELAEQIKISSTLFLMDEMIKIYMAKINLLKLYNVGLIQQLIPSL